MASGRLRTAALRLVPVAGAAWAVAGIATFHPNAAAWLALGLWSAAISGLLRAAAARSAQHRRPGHPEASSSRWGRSCRAFARKVGCWGKPGMAGAVVVLSLAAAATVASHVALAQPVRAHAASLALEGGRAVEVRAHVTGKVELRPDGALGFDAAASTIAAGARSHAVAVDVVVRVDPAEVDRLQRLDVGAELWARGTLSSAYPGERAVLVVWAGRGVEIIRGPEGVTAVTADLRRGLVRAVDGLPGQGAGLVPGLAVGDTAAVEPALDAAMKQSSLSHLTAVSGANCALVVGIAFGLAAALGAPRRVRIGSGLAALAGFVVLVTPEPSVARAATMAAVAMTALLLGRPGAGIGVLSLAVAVLLIADPWLAASLGFALSAVATASLLLLARPLADGLGRWMPRALALALSVPLAAQLACGPLLILISPQVPLYGVVANLLAGPAAPVATVLGLAACLTAPLPWLQDGLAALAWLPASWIAATAGTVSALPADTLPWWEGMIGAALLALVGGAVAVVLVGPRGRGRRTRALRVLCGVLVAGVAGTALGGGALSTIAGRWTLPASWAVLACDVGQGDAVLLRSGEALALVDTGPSPDALTSCLTRAGVDRVDLLVLTHFDADHAGGAPAVVGRVGTVLHGPPDSDGADILRDLAEGGARLAAASAGMSGSLDRARWRVLWPDPARSGSVPGNDASVVLDVRGGGIPPTLLLGDLSADPQRAVRTSGGLAPPYAIVKVAHHGSADQDAALYDASDPALAMVTVGADNDYGHPRAEILAVLSGGGARVARTDQDGVIAVWESRGAVSVWRERGG